METRTYTQVAGEIGRAPIAIADVLEEIAWSENARGRPMITALVVRMGQGTPSNGFFGVARRLGHSWDTHTEAMTFWHEECERVYEHWHQAYELADDQVSTLFQAILQGVQPLPR